MPRWPRSTICLTRTDVFQSDYLLCAAQSQGQQGGQHLLQAGDSRISMPAADWDIVQLFDGTRSISEVWKQVTTALGRNISKAHLQHWVSELGSRGILRAGRREPIPPPRQRDGGSLRRPPINAKDWPSELAYPPASVPGSLAQPGVMPSLHDVSAAPTRGLPAPAVLTQALIMLGRVLIWPLHNRWSVGLMLLITTACLCFAFSHRYDWLAHTILSQAPWRIVLSITLAIGILNVVTMAARAGAIERFGNARPSVHIIIDKMLPIPRLAVHGERLAGHLRRNNRLRVTAASLAGLLVLQALAVLIWALTASNMPVIASMATVVATAATISLLLRLNPLVTQDGYYLLCNYLGVLDLKYQSLGAIIGARRPWNTQQRRLPLRWLAAYGVISMAFSFGLLAIILWLIGGFLEARHQGAGIAVTLGAFGYFMVKQFSNLSLESNDIDKPPRKTWRPTKGQWIGAVILLIVALLPYPYAPSGEVEVLPRARADVRALTAGDIRSVLVNEGDMVEAGQTLVRLDDSLARSRVDAAQAQLASLNAELALLLRGAKDEEIELARQRVETADAALKLARSRLKRVERAYRSGGVTAQEYEQAAGSADVAQQEYLEAQRGLELVQSPAESERVDSLKSKIAQAEAELGAAQNELDMSEVRAPIAGRVVSSSLIYARGDYLERGEEVAIIENTQGLLARVYLPESSLSVIETGASVTAKLWAYPGASFSGQVTDIAPNAEPGEYGRIVRVQVALDERDERLKPGLTGNAKIRAGWQPVFIVFSRALVRFVMVEIWSWIP